MEKRKAIVTGSSSGIGKAITSILLKSGADVIGIARDNEKFEPNFDRYLPISLDLSNFEKIESVIPQLLLEHSDIDVLICNAGHGDFQALENFSSKQISKFINLNLISHIILCRHLVSYMKAKGNGDIIVIGSEASLAGKKKATLYSAAKFGLRGFTQALRDECSNRGVRVCLIIPGFDSMNFKPGDAENNAIETDDIAKIVCEIIKTRQGTIIDEINISPASKSIIFK